MLEILEILFSFFCRSTEVKSNDNNSYANAAKSAPGAGAEAAAGMVCLFSVEIYEIFQIF